MRLVTSQRVKRLVPYFLILGVICFFGYLYSGLGYFFLTLLGPVFFLAYWLRAFGGPLVELIPNEPFLNNFLLLLPMTLAYFGVVGLLFKGIINERGGIRILILVAFAAFLVYIHVVAFHELSLYWQGSGRAIPLPAAKA